MTEHLLVAGYGVQVKFTGPAGGLFGREDRILDAAVAMEIGYAVPRRNITRKLRNRAARLLGGSLDGRSVYDEVNNFYDVRSKIVYGRHPPSGKELRSAMQRGRTLARASLFALLCRGAPVDDWGNLDWDVVTVVMEDVESLERGKRLRAQTCLATPIHVERFNHSRLFELIGDAAG